ncbi:hypothetical protein HS088_TW08G00346 [Tripterygium wilfordii]|uniref:Inactive poly n=1 Tax=Tripterygium wilfordii TaxID=458696 RepID=A0A7J7DBW8_TRIWF|nr:probable inactive poly [ADP-ribose] polymerase SRO5 [Tripterygium wilfordii]KAF5743759.1 hypothetical protein HS088_TW08G00346 [Tripterygium wilfordii]
MENNRDSFMRISITIEPTAEVTPANGVNLANGSLDNHENRAASEFSSLETSIEDDALVSDGDSSATNGTNYGKVPSFGNDLTRLLQGDSVHDQLKRTFVQGLRFLEAQPEVVSIHRNSFPGPIGQAKLQAFQMFAKATEERRGGDANVKYAWYPATGDEIRRILQDGFGHANMTNGLHGCGVYLSPYESPMESVKRTVADKDGIHHLLRCRVILGKLELVPPGSKQCHPSSDQFDSGIGITGSPDRYIVWSTHMNSHILPEYVVSFLPPSCLKGLMLTSDSLKRPTSPWIPFPALMSSLSKFLPQRDMTLISKYYRDQKSKKISRNEMIKQVRKIAGDELLAAVIKSFRGKLLASGNCPQSIEQNRASERMGHGQNGRRSNG